VGIFERHDGQRDDRFEPIERVGGPREIRPSMRTGLVATGTLACPACDAPVSPGDGGLAPADSVACPVCAHAASVRDFLSLEVPARPARVNVWLVARVRAPARSA
jgi:hypothetical protein